MELRQGSFSNPDDPRMFKWYDFANPNVDPDIPVVLAFVTREVEHKRKGYVPGPELLLVRRGFLVGAMQGLWSPVAGVDDHYDENQDVATRRSLVDELDEEVGINESSISVLHKFGENRFSDPQIKGRTWVQNLFHVQANVHTVTVDWENMGAVWVPVSAASDFVRSGKIDDPHMATVVKDGTLLGEDGNLARFVDYLELS